MNCFVCDICGSVISGHYHGIVIDQQPGTVFGKDDYDLCPSCAKKLRLLLKKASKTGEFDDFPVDDDK